MCNHDLGVLLRLPAFDNAIQGESTRPPPENSNTSNPSRSKEDAAVSGMLEAMGVHELYCATYSCKEQPRISGLLMTLADGLRSKGQDIVAAKQKGENLDNRENSRRILHRLMSSTNRRMHKGFPEMFTYLLRKPMEYSSHEFVNLHVAAPFQIASGLLLAKIFDKSFGTRQCLQPRESSREESDFHIRAEAPYLAYTDYPFRPQQLEDFPLFFSLPVAVL